MFKIESLRGVKTFLCDYIHFKFGIIALLLETKKFLCFCAHLVDFRNCHLSFLCLAATFRILSDNV